MNNQPLAELQARIRLMELEHKAKQAQRRLVRAGLLPRRVTFNGITTQAEQRDADCDALYRQHNP